MKQFTLSDLRALKPCYDPGRYLPENWTGTAFDILDVKAAPFPDRLWILLRTDFFSEKFLRLYGVWCARQVQYLMQDERSIRALDVAEAYANGAATSEELDAAWAAALSADGAASDAPWAARAALWATAREAERAAWAASNAALWAAMVAASTAVMVAAWVAAQEIKLREMITAGIETGEVK